MVRSPYPAGVVSVLQPVIGRTTICSDIFYSVTLTLTAIIIGLISWVFNMRSAA